MNDGTVFLNLIKVKQSTWWFLLGNISCLCNTFSFDQRLQYLFIWRDKLWNNDCARRVTHGFRVTKLWRTQIKFWHIAFLFVFHAFRSGGKRKSREKSMPMDGTGVANRRRLRSWLGWARKLPQVRLGLDMAKLTQQHSNLPTVHLGRTSAR